MRVDVAVAARNYRRTDTGLVFDIDTLISSREQPLWRETCVFLSRWPESAERPASRPPRPPKAPKDSAVLAEFDVTRRTAWDYARVSMDFNPIHLSDRAAKFFGLRGSISHGMWSLARSLAQEPAPVIPGRCPHRDAVPDAGAAAGPRGDQGMDGRGPATACALRHSHRARAHVRVVAGRRRDDVNARASTGHHPAHRVVSTDARTTQSGSCSTTSRSRCWRKPWISTCAHDRSGRSSLRLPLPGRARVRGALSRPGPRRPGVHAAVTTRPAGRTAAAAADRRLGATRGTRKRSAVPSSRVGRLLRFGLLSGELALSAAVGSARQIRAARGPTSRRRC